MKKIMRYESQKIVAMNIDSISADIVIIIPRIFQYLGVLYFLAPCTVSIIIQIGIRPTPNQVKKLIIYLFLLNVPVSFDHRTKYLIKIVKKENFLVKLLAICFSVICQEFL